MEEKKKGRPRKIPQKQATERYRSDPENLEKFKEERLERMKKFLRGGGVATPYKSDNKDVFGKSDADAPRGDDKNECKVDLEIGAVNEVSEQDAKEIKSAFEGSFAQISDAQRQVEEISGLCNEHNEYADTVWAKYLTCSQIQTLGKVCRTDELIDDMLAALEEAGANQRWLTAARASFQCAIMEVYRAVLKPKGI